MTRYFSEDSEKQIASAVKWVQNNRTSITGEPSGPVVGARPPRFYKTQDVAPEQLPSGDEDFFALDCKLYKVSDNTSAGGGITGEETDLTETVYFNFVPRSRQLIQAAQFQGMIFAINSEQTFKPVELRKSSGEAGSLDDPCSFKYDILELGSEDLLESDVEPSPPYGLWKRTAIGAYVEADRGVVWNLTPTTYAIAWLNEVPEVAECEESQSIQLMWAGPYDDSKSYPANNAVSDGPYMMVSNKQTDAKAAPQPLDEPETKIGTVPTWAQVSGAGYETITGQRYTWSKGGQLLKIRVYIPAPSGGGGGGGGPGGG